IGGSAYLLNGTRLMRVDTTTGATSVLAGTAGTNYCQDGPTGTAVTFAPDTTVNPEIHLAGTDGTYIYTNDNCGVRTTDPATGTDTTITALPPGQPSDTMLSAGNYLYAALRASGISALVRIGKSDGSAQLIAGGAYTGHADGILTDAAFNTITGIASDGT